MAQPEIVSPEIAKKNARRRLIVIGMIIIATSLVAWYSPLRSWFNDVDFLRERVKSFGAWGPVIVILYHIVQVVIAPVPGQALDIVNGYVFGWPGIAASLIGISFGSILAIWLARRFGRHLVQRLIGETSMVVLDSLLKKSLPVLWLLLLLPGTPDDIICFALGLTTVRLRRAVAMVVLGRAPGVILAVALGVTGQKISPMVFLLAMGAVSVVVWWFIQRRQRRRL